LSPDNLRQNKGKARTVLVLCGVLGTMFILVAATPALYDIFCRVTGYGGTTQTADVAPGQIFDREVRVRFNADHAPDLPWAFDPVQRSMDIRVGENKLAFYKAKNLSQTPIKGMAVFNVTPPKAGIYFSKIDCFCFTEQTLEAGQQVDMPVSFFIDPAFMEDSNMQDVTSITLSYTFYSQTEDEAGKTASLEPR
jgi:cytochrome c oxidase assembly protein subunit 11